MKRKMSKFEYVIISFGVFLTVSMLYLFLAKSEQLGVWLGWISDTHKSAVGMLEYPPKGIQRKFQSTVEFLPISNKATIFDHDTLITDKSTEAILSLYDGTVIQIQPDSMIELVFQESGSFLDSAAEFVVKVEKGSVKGQSTTRKIKVETKVPKSNEGKTVVLEKIAPRPVVVAGSKESPKTEAPKIEIPKIEIPKKKNAGELCRFQLGEFAIAPGAVDAKRGLKFPYTILCEQGAPEVLNLVIKDASQKVVIKKDGVHVKEGVAIELSDYFESPGNYQLFWDEGASAPQVFSISAERAGIKFVKDGIFCDGSIRWTWANGLEPLGASAYEVSLLNEQRSFPAEKAELKIGALVQKYPAKFQVKSHSAGKAFVWDSPELTIDHLPVCHELSSPANHAKIKFAGSGINLLFTWKHLEDHPEVRFELSAKPDFSKVLYQKVVSLNFLQVRLSQAGVWYWRVVDLKTNEPSDIFSVNVR